MQQTDFPAPTRPISEWPARRVAGAFEVRNGTVLQLTGNGQAIGRSYVPPPPPMGSEAERIQAALLARRERSWERAEWCIYAIALGFGLALFMGVLR